MHKEDPFIQGFLGGEPDILHKIYTQYFPAVRGYILNHDGSDTQAEDIFQNALVLLFVKLKHRKLEIQSFENYLFIVCRNMWRRECSKKRVTNVDTLPLVDETVDSAQFSIEQGQWDLYKEKFQELSENCRKLLGMTLKKVAYKEIVAFFNYSSETVARQRVFKCKSRLIQLIKKDSRYLRLKI